MEAVVYSALEEICSRGADGITLGNLWTKTESCVSSNGLYLCSNVKKVVWSNLVNVPGLCFECKGVAYDPKICSVEDCEEMGMEMKIVADVNLFSSFLGIYDIKDGISDRQDCILKRLALARKDGVTQNELVKELGIDNKTMYYELTGLVTRGLIVRQSTMNTNMIYLQRYAKNSGNSQRLETTNEDKDKVKVVTSDEFSDQILELPIMQQIYDMIDAQGTKGMILNEVYKRLGINNKQYYPRVLDMVSRFRMHLAAEQLNKSVVYRVWTYGNFDKEIINTPKVDGETREEHKVDNTSNSVSLEIPSSPSTAPRRRRSYTTYPCLGLNSATTQREKWILEILQEEKVVLKPQLHRMLKNLEKLENKLTVMDRKTLERSLNKLQKDGYCKCISYDDQKRKTDVILHPSVYEAVDLSDRIREKLAFPTLHKNKSKEAANVNEHEFQPLKLASLSHKRKRPAKGKPISNEKMERSSSQRSFEDHDTLTLVDEKDGQKEVVESSCQKRFLWTENKDRLLVIEYVKRRVTLGAKFHGVDWTSLKSLPGPPHKCKRRMSNLMRNTQFRKSVMRLCNMLSVKYSNDMNTEERWDDFEDKDIKMVLDEVLRYKQVTKLDANKSTPRESDEKTLGSLATSINDFGTHVFKSLAVSNAIELFKLIFLSTAKGPEVLHLLAKTLRQYSENDLFTAFNYLRNKNFMGRGNDISHSVLSRKFLHNISSSPFPVRTGKRADKMAKWLHERENELLETGVDLPANLECGDVIQLSALMSSGEISMFPCLPDEGIGKIEDLKKRKCDENEVCSVEIAKKPKTEICSRKGKGFPGIKLSVRCSLLKVSQAVTLSSRDESERVASSQHIEGILKSNESTWEAMTCYARHLVSSSSAEEVSSFCPDLFKTVYSAIKEARDQGLCMEEISQIIDDVHGEKMPELIVEVLETFGRVIKVNGYDYVHVVDSKYRSKYLLTSMASHQHELDLEELQSCKIDYLSSCRPILPWVNGDGTINEIVYKGLVRRVLGIVMQNPGILEDRVISRMNVLNPQSCRNLLELMILDSHIVVRKMYQSISSKEPPAMLRHLLGCSFKKPRLVCKKHLYANLTTISCL